MAFDWQKLLGKDRWAGVIPPIEVLDTADCQQSNVNSNLIYGSVTYAISRA